MSADWGLGLAGGALQLGSYAIAIWAMTVAPIAHRGGVARDQRAVRRRRSRWSCCKEPLRASRIAAALLIVTGLALIRLA